MKTLLITLTMVLFTSLTFAQFPQSESPDSCCYISDDLRAAIFMDEHKMINVKIAKVPGELIKIRVKENNKVLYQQRVKSYAMVDLKYDVNQFPNGEYLLEIVKDKKVVYSKIIELDSTNNFLAQRN